MTVQHNNNTTADDHHQLVVVVDITYRDVQFLRFEGFENLFFIVLLFE